MRALSGVLGFAWFCITCLTTEATCLNRHSFGICASTTECFQEAVRQHAKEAAASGAVVPLALEEEVGQCGAIVLLGNAGVPRSSHRFGSCMCSSCFIKQRFAHFLAVFLVVCKAAVVLTFACRS